jgi:hypothetical protein
MMFHSGLLIAVAEEPKGIPEQPAAIEEPPYSGWDDLGEQEEPIHKLENISGEFEGDEIRILDFTRPEYFFHQDGIYIVRKNGQSTSRWILGNDSVVASKTFPNPKSGWKKFWRAVRSSGLFTLPSSIEPENTVQWERVVALIEYRDKRGYRSYIFCKPHLPCRQGLSEVKKVMKFMKIVDREFPNAIPEFWMEKVDLTIK